MLNNIVRISITGKNPIFFIKRYFKNINYDKFKLINYNEIRLNISYDDYLYLKDIKSIYNIEILKSYGIFKYINIIKNNYSFIISFIISLIFLFILANTIFEVEIVHNDSNVRSIVGESLKENNISKYKLIPNFNKRKKIIDKIIKENKDTIEWMEIERKGSKLIVKITERRLNKKEDDNEPRHIVAKKSGIITKIEASNGVIVKKIKDYVTKGEIVISGDIIKDETVKGQVKAKGVVFAEVWYNVKISYPLYYKEVIYLDDVKNNIIINFLGKEISLRKNYKTKVSNKSYNLIKSKIVPFSVRLEKQRKTKIVKKKYTKKEVIKIANDLATNKLNKKIGVNDSIISKKTLNLSYNNSKIEIDVFFKVNEDITDYMPVDKSLLENNNQNQD